MWDHTAHSERLHEALFHQKKKGALREEGGESAFSFSLLLTVNAYKGNFFFH